MTYGASPRATIALVLGGRALAFLRGRDYVLPNDVDEVALDVLRHRIVLSYEALADDLDADTILTRVLRAVPIPDVVLQRRMTLMITAPDRLLHRLEWRVVRRLDGRVQGGYRTPRRGTGLDFAGLRPYVEGDDARHIDWNVTARLDEPQVREFNEDRELTTWLVLDRSASMVVGGPGRGKQDVLAELALILARLLGRNGNRVGAVLYDTGTTRIVPPGTGRSHALRIGRELDRGPDSRAAATTDLAAMLDTVASLARRCLVVVISDFIGTGEWQRPLIRLAHRNEVVALRIVDGADDALPEVGLIVVEDAETGRAAPRRLRRPVVPRPVPRRGRRAGGRTSVRHAPGRGAAAPGRHRQRSRRDAAGGHRRDPSEARMSLSYPLLLVLGLLVAAALVVGAVLAGRRRSAALAAAGVSVAGRRNRPLGPWFFIGGVVLLAVAVAGPAASLPVGRSAGTVILAMDVSNSMSADDVTPSRLAAAQQAALSFIDAQPDSVDIGVVGFDQGALTTSPPSADRAAAKAAVQRLRTAGGTSLASAILGSLSAITGKPVRIGEDGDLPDIGYWGSATIVLFSDGEDQGGSGGSDAVTAAATIAQNAGVHIEAVGVGTADGSDRRDRRLPAAHGSGYGAVDRHRPGHRRPLPPGLRRGAARRCRRPPSTSG